MTKNKQSEIEIPILTDVIGVTTDHAEPGSVTEEAHANENTRQQDLTQRTAEFENTIKAIINKKLQEHFAVASKTISEEVITEVHQWLANKQNSKN